MTRRFHPSLLISIVYCCFMILYTWYVSTHLGSFGSNKSDYLFYYLKLLATGSFLFFLLQGLAFRSKNWGLLLLLPSGILLVSVLAGWLIVWALGIHSDPAGMMLVTLLAILMSFFALRLIGPGRKKKRHR